MDLKPLIEQLRRDGDPEVRAQAIQQIAAAGKGSAYTPEVVQALVEALDDDDPVVQEWATVALRRLKGDPQALDAMWVCFQIEQRETLRCWAVAGLGYIAVGRSCTRWSSSAAGETQDAPPFQIRTLAAELGQYPRLLLSRAAVSIVGSRPTWSPGPDNRSGSPRRARGLFVGVTPRIATGVAHLEGPVAHPASGSGTSPLGVVVFGRQRFLAVGPRIGNRSTPAVGAADLVEP